MTWTRQQMAAIAARERSDGDYVNLGIGIPTLVANYVPDGVNVLLQSKTGLLGMGPFPPDGDEHPDLINAGKQTVTAVEGASYFDSATRFGMIRSTSPPTASWCGNLLPELSFRSTSRHRCGAHEPRRTMTAPLQVPGTGRGSTT